MRIATNKAEDLFSIYIRYGTNESALKDFKREYRFHEKRKWRFDFAWPEYKIAVEIEGGVFTNGRHTRGVGFTKDCEKYNEAICDGWRLLRITSEQVSNGQGLNWLEKLYKGNKNE